MTRKAALLFFSIALVVIFLPAAVVSLGRRSETPQQDTEKTRPEDENKNKTISIGQLHFYRADQKKVVVMELEEYLVGVLLAEMPSSFEMEALKAQAVIARTYTLHQRSEEHTSGRQISVPTALTARPGLIRWKPWWNGVLKAKAFSSESGRQLQRHQAKWLSTRKN